MAKASNGYLQPNPFGTYRDPQTGLWLVIPAEVKNCKPEVKSKIPCN